MKCISKEGNRRREVGNRQLEVSTAESTSALSFALDEGMRGRPPEASLGVAIPWCGGAEGPEC